YLPRALGFVQNVPTYYAYNITSITTSEAYVKLTWIFDPKTTLTDNLYWVLTEAGWRIASIGRPGSKSGFTLGSVNTYSKVTFTGTCLPASKPNVFPPNPMHLYARAVFSRWSGKHTAVF